MQVETSPYCDLGINFGTIIIIIIWHHSTARMEVNVFHFVVSALWHED